MKKWMSLLFITTTFKIFAAQLYPYETDIQLGLFLPNLGKNQHISIDSLIGNRYTVSNPTNLSGLVGISTYGLKIQKLNTLIGVNGLWMFKPTVQGTIYLENLYPNLTYQYQINYFPVMAVSKTMLPIQSSLINLEFGVGPSFIRAYDYQEFSKNTHTIPSHSFKNYVTTSVAAMAGAGIHLTPQHNKTLEIGYRFMYLGQGKLQPNNSTILNALSTGNNYANTLMLSLVL